jgi:hypothetical protein
MILIGLIGFDSVQILLGNLEKNKEVGIKPIKPIKPINFLFLIKNIKLIRSSP